MGDVALSVPVIRAVLEQHPNVAITLVTRKAFQPLFAGLAVDFVFPDLYGRHKGIAGLFRLYNELKDKHTWRAVVDLHHVLRSKILGTFFRLSGVPFFRIDKGRSEKKQLTSTSKKQFIPLKHTTERYASVFALAGLNISLNKGSEGFSFSMSPDAQALLGQKTNRWIGVAPFAQHKQKMYPMELMKQVIQSLDNQGYRVFVFGGGKSEKAMADTLCEGSAHAQNLIGTFSLSDELAILGQLDVLISMDSANMHMAALSQVPIVSVWGATHPFAGFDAFLPTHKNHPVQADLACRPCSVFGNKPCHRGDFACMYEIAPQTVVEKVDMVLKSSQ